MFLDLPRRKVFAHIRSFVALFLLHFPLLVDQENSGQTHKTEPAESNARFLLVTPNSPRGALTHDPEMLVAGPSNGVPHPSSVLQKSPISREGGPSGATPATSGSFADSSSRRVSVMGQPGGAPETTTERIMTSLQLAFSMVASVIFIFGLVNRADLITGEDGWNEIFVVLGSLFVFPIASLVYETVQRHFPFTISKKTEATIWMWGLRVALFCVYCVQQGLFLTYLVLYSGPTCWIFLLPDIAFVLLMVLSSKFSTIAVNLYILVLAAKFAVFWPNLDQSDAAVNPFADRNNQFGPNGLLASLMLTIPIIQFPVLLSRLAVGMSITQAYTTNMAAVFAHLLHYLDVLEMYMLGLERNSFAGDVQSLILIFVLMGLVCCNLYYVTLFFNDDTVERMLQKLQPNQVMDALGGGAEQNSNDDTLLHYFVWVLFFIDLPYATMRLVAFVVHGTRISTFFAKNLMMMASVTMMLVQHSKKRA